MSAPEPKPEVTPQRLIAQVQALCWQLARLAAAPEPGLHLTPRDCHRLDDLVGLGASRAPETLLAAVERLASLRFGDIRIPFTPGQLSEIQHRAAKRGRTVEAEMQAVVARIRDELFFQGG